MSVMGSRKTNVYECPVQSGPVLAIVLVVVVSSDGVAPVVAFLCFDRAVSSPRVIGNADRGNQ